MQRIDCWAVIKYRVVCRIHIGIAHVVYQTLQIQLDRTQRGYDFMRHFCIFQLQYSITWHKARENKLHHILLLPQVLSQCLQFFLINRTSCVLVRETWQIISCHSQFLQIFTGNIVHWNYFWWHCKLDNEIQSILGPAYQNQAVWMTQDIESFILILHISNLYSGASNQS